MIYSWLCLSSHNPNIGTRRVITNHGHCCTDDDSLRPVEFRDWLLGCLLGSGRKNLSDPLVVLLVPLLVVVLVVVLVVELSMV